LNRFPKARVLENDAEFAIWVQEMVSFIELPQRSLTLPLDIQGTAFQHRVWRALQAIPIGATVTYAELARRIGRPTAVRAVGRACGANPVAVIIPCHRAVGKDGKLHGYRWGVERKRALLQREAAVNSPLERRRG
jgi:AraC family transcriptional regulator, regulatory protein of adaptative response / methylated-DNA-[protein]-cysteine methyltransferase